VNFAGNDSHHEDTKVRSEVSLKILILVSRRINSETVLGWRSVRFAIGQCRSACVQLRIGHYVVFVSFLQNESVAELFQQNIRFYFVSSCLGVRFLCRTSCELAEPTT
jgi:hypothetical protein